MRNWSGASLDGRSAAWRGKYGRCQHREESSPRLLSPRKPEVSDWRKGHLAGQSFGPTVSVRHTRFLFYGSTRCQKPLPSPSTASRQSPMLTRPLLSSASFFMLKWYDRFIFHTFRFKNWIDNECNTKLTLQIWISENLRFSENSLKFRDYHCFKFRV